MAGNFFAGPVRRPSSGPYQPRSPGFRESHGNSGLSGLSGRGGQALPFEWLYKATWDPLNGYIMLYRALSTATQGCIGQRCAIIVLYVFLNKSVLKYEHLTIDLRVLVLLENPKKLVGRILP